MQEIVRDGFHVAGIEIQKGGGLVELHLQSVDDIGQPDSGHGIRLHWSAPARPPSALQYIEEEPAARGRGSPSVLLVGLTFFATPALQLQSKRPEGGVLL
jgi:hypothetical protein